MIRATVIATALSLALPAGAEPPVLTLPIDCTLGQTCYIEDYVDADPGPGQSDYTGGLKSRDGHRGTDIVLLDFDMMQAGVNVLAAAPGMVAATRDGMVDRSVTDENRAQIAGRECGNAVRINHSDGWQTLYCHMAQGSIMVKQGDQVTAGTVLGRVGLSGLTNIPHVHLTVLKDGEIIDPFNTTPQDSLWQDLPDYHRTGLFTAGFSTAVPSFEDVQSGAARETSGTAKMPIVLYAYAFHPQAGDTLTLTATGPTQEIFHEIITIDAAKAHLFRAFGRKSPAAGWPVGDYRGYVVMQRGDQVLAVRHADFTVE